MRIAPYFHLACNLPRFEPHGVWLANCFTGINQEDLLNMKMTSNRCAVLFIGVVVLGLSPFAFAQEEAPPERSEAHPTRFAVAAIAGLTGVRESANSTAQSTGLDSSRKLGLGVGLLIERPFMPEVSVEIGVLYVQRRFELGNSLLRLTRTVPTLFIPLEMRVWLGDTLSAVGGVFGAFRTGDQTDEVTTGSTSLGTFSSSEREALECGLTLAATFNFGPIGKSGIFLEGRYNRGFTNSAKNGVFDERIDDLLVLAGIRL